MKVIEARLAPGGGLSRMAATAVLLLWRSRQFSTADIAELLSVPEADVARLVSVARSLALEGVGA